MQADLFGGTPAELVLAPQAKLLQGLALPYMPRLLAALEQIQHAAPFRHMVTPGGQPMSVALTNCGALGWTSDRHGYRYSPLDPDTGQPWPPLPEVLLQLAQEAAARAGFAGFVPDACLVNRYLPGARLSLHQDKDERDYSAPIVSVSLGIPATFLLGGFDRVGKTLRVPLVHGDVVVWGGADRLRYHGVLPVAQAEHPLLGAQRINLTLRKAG
jgi:alkylated DNA repair protein (DNA oxidative demethylase)